MYRILIVDDETIILSGIKFLVDWEKYDCTIADTARNGQDALEKIRLCVPDIVLCDINMPVMGGIELLRTVDAEFPSVVFIMLTNLQEFDLAKDAIRYRAVDYLTRQLFCPGSNFWLTGKSMTVRSQTLPVTDRMHWKRSGSVCRISCCAISICR